MSALFNGRKGAKEIQQPAPVFFTPEQERRMTVGYKYKSPDVSVDASQGGQQMTVEEQKANARMEKQSMIQKILISQRESYFIPEFLEKKTLKELRTIYAQVRETGGET